MVCILSEYRQRHYRGLLLSKILRSGIFVPGRFPFCNVFVTGILRILLTFPQNDGIIIDKLYQFDHKRRDILICYNEIGLGLSVAALLVALSNLIYTLMDHHIGKPQNTAYISILGLIAINAACELLNTFTSRTAMESDVSYLIMRVTQFIFRNEIACQFVESVHSMISDLVPGYIHEGKYHLNIAFGCTGGHHRSVAIANAVAAKFQEDGMRVRIHHRDLDLQNKKG